MRIEDQSKGRRARIEDAIPGQTVVWEGDVCLKTDDPSGLECVCLATGTVYALDEGDTVTLTEYVAVRDD